MSDSAENKSDLVQFSIYYNTQFAQNQTVI